MAENAPRPTDLSPGVGVGVPSLRDQGPSSAFRACANACLRGSMRLGLEDARG